MATVAAVAELDFIVAAGQTVALLGPNGAGKTTTIAMLLGLLEPSARHDPHPGRADAAAAPAGAAADELHQPLSRSAAAADRAPEPAHLCRPLRRRPAEGAHRRACPRPRPRGLPRPAVRPAVGRAEDPRAAGQGADQRAGAAAARRAHGLARPRHRRPAARPSRALPGAHPRPPCCWPRTTWARSSGWRTMC